MSEKEEKFYHCSFCGKGQDEVRKLISGPSVFICDSCITICSDIIKDDIDPDEEISEETIPSPKELKEYLDEYVIGQNHAKEVISVAVCNHYKRLKTPIVDGIEIEKSNIILAGPSGSGKTHLAKTIAKKLDVPIAIADATSVTEAGYVGDDVESIITRLLQVADYDIERAQRGIIFIDEIDKKSRKGDSASITRDVSGEGVQQALLKIIEGTEVRVPPQGGRKHPTQELITIDTSNILFIVSGAFVGLDGVVEKRISESSSIGFGAVVNDQRKKKKVNELLGKVEPEDFVSYGLIPELVGRLPIIACLLELSEEELVKVLTEPKNALSKQYQKLFEISGMNLDFDDDALVEIVKIAIKRKTGARGLRAVIEEKLHNVQYNLDDIKNNGAKRIVINKETIVSNADPLLIFNDVTS